MGGMCNNENVVNQVNIFPMESVMRSRLYWNISENLETEVLQP